MKPLNLSSAKILILHANAGAGHRKAAEAVFHGLKARGAGNVTCLDALEYTNAFFKKAYPAGYEFMVGKLPNLWEIFFTLTDKPALQPLFQGCRRLYNGLNAGPLVEFIEQGAFDVIITAHFLSTEVVGHLRLSDRIPNTRLVTLVTDFDVHRIWLSQGVDLYCVALPSTAKRLASLGVAEDRIAVTGIPVDEKFVVSRDKAEVRRSLGLAPDKFTILLSTSSFGFGPIEALAELLADMQMVIICGKNTSLQSRLMAKARLLHKVCGFVDNMEEMLAAADVMITKPGGLSITEALVYHLPLMFFSAIPGQEEGNVRVLASHGVGLSNKSLPEIAAEIRRLATHPQELKTACASSEALARPDSVARIIERLF